METATEAVATRFEVLPPTQVCDIRRRFRHVKAHTMGAFYASDGHLIGMSVRPGGHGGDHVSAVDPGMLPADQREEAGKIRLAGRSIDLGHHMNHYGHFITETLSRLWYTYERPSENFDNYLVRPFIFNNGEVILAPFHRYFYGLFGISGERVLTIRDPLKVEHLVVPQQLWVINDFCYEHLRDLYAFVRARHAGRSRFERIFLERAPGTASRHPRAAEIREFFVSKGFEALNAGDITMQAQLEVYANCKIMAGLSGTVLHNCLFAPPDTIVIEIGDARTRAAPLRMQEICTALARATAIYIPYSDEPDGLPGLDGIQRSLESLLLRAC